MMLINNTKQTLQAFKIAISYNDEAGFLAICKIIKLFKLMKINAVFEPIDIAGENYKKGIKYGIEEQNLTHLLANNILIHTQFDLLSFDEMEQINPDEYINIAMENLVIKRFIGNGQFLTTETKYAKMVNNSSNNEGTEDVDDIDFSFAIGKQYANCLLKKINDDGIYQFLIELFDFLGLAEQKNFLTGFTSLEEAEMWLKDNTVDKVVEIQNDKIAFLYNEHDLVENGKLTEKITEIKTTLNGNFLVSNLVQNIKEKHIKLPDGLRLYQIMAYGIEVYPNVNFWNRVVKNPVIILDKNDDGRVDEIFTMEDANV